MTVERVSAAVAPAGQLRPQRSPTWMLDQLPVAMLDQDFFRRFVSIFQELGASLLEDADNVEHAADASVAPQPMLPYLASWIGVETIDDSQPEELQRRIVSSAAKTLTWRGTARGLRSYLELISEGPVEVEEGGGIWRAGEAPDDTSWVVMRVRSTGQLELDDFVDVVRDEVPAHVRAELYVGPDRVWTSEEEWPA
ncbi:phage tail protein [Nocardioides sp. YIM 152315]|uniref:phage tail protein n=1 Tax=Nocardioides sp. YIM 152315 TaxID=3031760 RepID=UPI0023DACF83|nr:phage tail protein [Nocardioides sp. YIM 152315]MDF1603313.1 phage tail protein [Nocardioides sp. YIM 152315]